MLEKKVLHKKGDCEERRTIEAYYRCTGCTCDYDPYSCTGCASSPSTDHQNVVTSHNNWVAQSIYNVSYHNING